MREKIIPTPRVEQPVVRSEAFWFSLITGLKPKDFLPARRGRMFGPRTKQNPV
jgi:hypothetical protein